VFSYTAGIIQSSGAMMAILLQLTGQGLLGMKSCFGLMLGANVGTCVTGLLASIGRSREALRLAMALLLFRLTSSLVLLPFGGPFSKLVARACQLDDTSTRPSDVTLMLASSHTLFNLIFALGALPFCHLGVPIIRGLIPLTPEEIAHMDKKQAELDLKAKLAAKAAAKKAKEDQHLAERLRLRDIKLKNPGL
jgi:phosphate:Na+ symporter